MRWMLVLLLSASSAVAAKPTAFADGILLAQESVKTGEMDCETTGSSTHCTPTTRWVYRVRMGDSEIPLVPVASGKSTLLAVATAGVSTRLQKQSVLWKLPSGAHFEYRQEGRKIRIRSGNRESLYEIYLDH